MCKQERLELVQKIIVLKVVVSAQFTTLTRRTHSGLVMRRRRVVLVLVFQNSPKCLLSIQPKVVHFVLTVVRILCPLLNCDKITNTVVDSNSGRGINMLLVTLKEPCQCSCLSACVGSLILTCSIFYLLFLQSESNVTPEKHLRCEVKWRTSDTNGPASLISS